MKGAEDPARPQLALFGGTQVIKEGDPAGFRELWEAWLRCTKEASGTARSAHRVEAAREFLRLKKKRALPDVAELVVSIEAQAQSARWQAGTIPDLRTWLHQERWSDDPAALTWNGNERDARRSGPKPPAGLSKYEQEIWLENYWIEYHRRHP